MGLMDHPISLFYLQKLQTRLELESIKISSIQFSQAYFLN